EGVASGGARARLARLARSALGSLEAVDLQAQVGEVALDDLELGEQAVQIGARRQVQQGEQRLDVAVGLPLGLEPPLERARHRLREERAAEQVLGQTREIVTVQHERAPGACMWRGG